MDGSIPRTLDMADAFDAIGDLYSASSPCEAARVVARTLDAMIPAESIGIYLYDPVEDLMRRVAGTREDGAATTLKLGAGAIGRALLACADDAYREPCLGDEALLVRTIRVRCRVRAAIVIARSSDFTDGEVHLADYVAGRFGETLAL